MTKEDYMYLPKERLAELLADGSGNGTRKAETDGIPCHMPGGLCTNPNMDCPGCPGKLSWGISVGAPTETATDEVVDLMFKLCCGMFGHYDYFTNERWREVEGFKDADRAQVHCAFMHKALHDQFGITGAPTGSAWHAGVDEESYRDYMEEWEPVFESYMDWCDRQR